MNHELFTIYQPKMEKAVESYQKSTAVFFVKLMVIYKYAFGGAVIYNFHEKYVCLIQPNES